MSCTIQNGIQTLLIRACAPANVWEECLNGVSNACNRVARPGCMNMTEELLADVKPSVRDLQIFGSKVFVRVPDKTRSL